MPPGSTEGFDPGHAKLIDDCINGNPTSRPSAKDVLEAIEGFLRSGARIP
jgi:UDP-N-acetylmuramyl pentapeptide synthase